LDETYERILLGIDEEKWEYALRLFQCLAVACRPLQAKELAEVLAVEFDAGGTPKLNVDLRPKDAEEAVLSACSTLVAIVRPATLDVHPDIGDQRDTGIVQFSHYSVKEFLTSSRLLSGTPTVSRFYISPEPANIILAQSCIGTLLRLHNFVNNNDFRGFPLAGYAVRNWVDHARVDGVASQIRIGMESLFDPDLPHFTVWVDLQRQTPWGGFSEPKKSPLCYAALHGLDGVVKYLVIRCHQNINAADADSVTPLLAAQSGGHFGIAQFLLVQGANVDCLGGIRQTPLHRASSSGQLDIVQLLLDWGADVDHRGPFKLTPLHEASIRGHLDVVQRLINYGADINAGDFEGTTPLHFASQHGKLHVMQLLLESGADVNTQNRADLTPLHKALIDGHLDVVQKLITSGANINARDDKRRTPLHYASEQEKLNVVQLLPMWGADVNTRDRTNSIPLHGASTHYTVDVFRQLINFGADINKCP